MTNISTLDTIDAALDIFIIIFVTSAVIYAVYKMNKSIPPFPRK